MGEFGGGGHKWPGDAGGRGTDKGDEASSKLSQGAALSREHLQTANNTMFLPDFLKCSQCLCLCLLLP